MKEKSVYLLDFSTGFIFSRVLSMLWASLVWTQWRGKGFFLWWRNCRILFIWL